MPSAARRTGIRIAAIIALLGGIVAVPATPAHAARSCAYFDFAKSSPNNSTLTWKYYDDFGRCIRAISWRAGSGVNTDPCDKSTTSSPDGGWLPNGWYDVTAMQHDWNGSAIWGRVWRLNDKACSDGTLRTELFIHTEETPSATQDCPSGVNDSPQCWDSYPSGNGTNDYYSAGCIKVRRNSPEGTWANDHGSAHTAWHNNGGGSSHGTFTRTDSVFVHT